jgi:hypothetical protein
LTRQGERKKKGKGKGGKKEKKGIRNYGIKRKEREIKRNI